MCLCCSQIPKTGFLVSRPNNHQNHIFFYCRFCYLLTMLFAHYAAKAKGDWAHCFAVGPVGFWSDQIWNIRFLQI